MPTSKKAPGVDGAGSILSTVSGPSTATPPGSLGNSNPQGDVLLEKQVAGMDLAAQMPYNPNKPGEYGDAARTPQAGQTGKPASDLASASTAAEVIASPKTGTGVAPGVN